MYSFWCSPWHISPQHSPFHITCICVLLTLAALFPLFTSCTLYTLNSHGHLPLPFPAFLPQKLCVRKTVPSSHTHLGIPESPLSYLDTLFSIFRLGAGLALPTSVLDQPEASPPAHFCPVSLCLLACSGRGGKKHGFAGAGMWCSFFV